MPKIKVKRFKQESDHRQTDTHTHTDGRYQTYYFSVCICAYECDDVDVLSYHDVNVTNVTTQLISNASCDARLTIHLGWLVEKTNNGRHLGQNKNGRGNSDTGSPERQQRDRVDGLMIVCTRCRHNQLLQFSISVDQRQTTTVSCALQLYTCIT